MAPYVRAGLLGGAGVESVVDNDIPFQVGYPSAAWHMTCVGGTAQSKNPGSQDWCHPVALILSRFHLGDSIEKPDEDRKDCDRPL